MHAPACAGPAPLRACPHARPPPAASLLASPRYTFTPWWLLVFTILPEIPEDLASNPAAAAEYMQRATASCGLTQKAICKVNLFDKRRWEQRAKAGMVPGYGQAEFEMISRLQVGLGGGFEGARKLATSRPLLGLPSAYLRATAVQQKPVHDGPHTHAFARAQPAV
jgi:hypothetical protein